MTGNNWHRLSSENFLPNSPTAQTVRLVHRVGNTSKHCKTEIMFSSEKLTVKLVLLSVNTSYGCNFDVINNLK